MARILARHDALFPLEELDIAPGDAAEAGLGQVKVRNLSGGIAALHSAWRV